MVDSHIETMGRDLAMRNDSLEHEPFSPADFDDNVRLSVNFNDVLGLIDELGS